jgi:hypothetical protein
MSVPYALALIFSIQSAPEPLLDAPPLDWVTARAPYGMDITLDGKIWVNTNRTGSRDDYAILANDLYKAVTSGTKSPRIWIRGYHLRNAAVKYRETKQLVTINCQRDTIWIERKLFYSSDGEVLATAGPHTSEPVVPGSIGESWRDAVCGG